VLQGFTPQLWPDVLKAGTGNLRLGFGAGIQQVRTSLGKPTKTWSFTQEKIGIEPANMD